MRSPLQPGAAVRECVWCHSKRLTAYPTPISHYGARTYAFARCEDCEVRFATPFDISGIDYEQIQRRHAGYVSTTATNEYVHALLSAGPGPVWADRAVDFLCRRTGADSRFDHVLRLCIEAQREGRRLRILEVGCNLGFLGAIVVRYGHEYIGLDVQADAIACARRYYGDHFVCMPVEEFASAAPVPFDLVCSFEVIEHVPDPRAFLTSCLALLAPMGRLVLSTPNGDLVRRDQWFPIDLPPIHLTVFARRTFEVAMPPGYELGFPFSVQPRSDLSGVGWWLRRWSTLSNGAPVSDPTDDRFYARAEATSIDVVGRFSLARYAGESAKMLCKQLAFIVLAAVGRRIGNPLVAEFRRVAARPDRQPT